jgi:hypothetical protein
MHADAQSVPEKPRRWRPQFSLKMLFLLTALAAVLLSWWRVRQDTRKMLELDAIVGHIATHGDETLCISFYQPDTRGPEVLTEQVIADSIAVYRIGRVKSITIVGRYARDSGADPVELTAGAWDYLASLNLKSLSVWGLDDSSVPQLARLSSLDKLTVENSRITPKGERLLRKALPQCKISLAEFETYY